MREERFRSDLYYRISAFPIVLPPLRERRSDIELLARALLRRVRPSHPQTLSAAALHRLEAYDFPGNVRELRNIVERASLLAANGAIEVVHLPEAVRRVVPGGAGTAPFPQPLRDAERDALRVALREHAGSRRELAKKLGLSERSLYRKLRALERNGA